MRIDPDFRRNPPKDRPYCVQCQRAVNPLTARRVTVDWDTWEIVEGGEEFIGPDCWNEAQNS